MTIYLVVLISLLSQIGFGGSRVAVSLFALELGANQFMVGVIIALYSLCPMFLSIVIGRLSDRVPPYVPMIWGSVMMLAALLLPLASPGMVALCVLAFLNGLGHLVFSIPLEATVGGIGGPQHRARNYALITMGWSIANFVGPLITGFLIDHVGNQRVFWVLSLFVALPIPLLWWRRSVLSSTVKPGAGEEGVSRSVMDLWRIPSLRATFIAGGIIGSAQDLFQFYMPVYGHSAGLSASAIGIVLAMYYVPAPSLAYDSVRFIMTGLPLGWMLRGLHFWGASFTVVAAGVHMLRVFTFGSYKAPREVTWISGMLMLGIVYWWGASTMLIDRSVADLSSTSAIAISAGSLLAGWLIYDLLCRLIRNDALLGAVIYLLLVAAAWGFQQVFSARAAYIHVGATIGTIMVASVFFVIIPGQRKMVEAVKAANKHGTIVSYDLNYRPSLWKSIGGQKKAREVNREIAKHVDVMIGNEEDFTASLGFEVPDTDENLSSIEIENFKKMIGAVTKEFPNFKVIATTLRTVNSASNNDWGAVCWADGVFHEATLREGLEIYDRVGGGDSFASGLVYGLMEKGDPALAVEYGAAHGALAMTTPGDTSMASLAEVEHLVKGGSARVNR